MPGLHMQNNPLVCIIGCLEFTLADMLLRFCLDLLWILIQIFSSEFTLKKV